MTFDEIPAGTALFIDANPFIYAVTADPKYGPACQRLLQRIENKELQGFTSAHVVAEMAHRLMTIEAAALLGRSHRHGQLAQATPPRSTALEPLPTGYR